MQYCQFIRRQVKQLFRLFAYTADHKPPKPGQQFIDKAFKVHTIAVYLVQPCQGRGKIPCKQGLGKVGDHLVTDQPQYISYLLAGYGITAVGKYLIQKTKAVPNRTARLPDHHIQSCLINLNSFSCSKRCKMIIQFFMGNPFQLIPLTTGQDGHRHLVQFRGGNHEIDMFRRLFKGFERRIKGLGGEHMYFIDDNDLEARVGRHEANIFLQLTNLLNTTVGGTIDFVQINRTAGHNLHAGTAGITGFRNRPLLTVQSLSHDPGQGGLAGTANPAEYQCMGNPVLAQGILQGPDNSLLADNLCKRLRPRFSGKDEIGQSNFLGVRD